MKRRLLAWMFLALFILLIINLMFFRVYLTESVFLYALMIALFFFSRGYLKGNGNHGAKAEVPDEEEEGESEHEGKEEIGGGPDESCENNAGPGKDGDTRD